MRTLTRIMMVVVLLLLPVIMTGASLELPGVGCHAEHCCQVAECHAHNPGDSQQVHGHHHHHRHCHGRIFLLQDAGLRAEQSPIAGAPAPPVPFFQACPAACAHGTVTTLQLIPAPYPGYSSPLRC